MKPIVNFPFIERSLQTSALKIQDFFATQPRLAYYLGRSVAYIKPASYALVGAGVLFAAYKLFQVYYPKTQSKDNASLAAPAAENPRAAGSIPVLATLLFVLYFLDSLTNSSPY